ncbi:hypothetical protein GCM10023191_102370 [Actinoallomurus oryzae]|uniref:Histidine kinase/HSP90-like ATPase domain-containing protein n=1 Tax=Actinoallomurus oryzae TaxID=502180 RepID=A0ABP8RAS5_9ACTN
MTDTATTIPADPVMFRRSFAGLPECVADAREFLADCLAGTAWPIDEVVLAADELVTNAVRHSRSGGPGGKFDVRLRIKPACMVQVEICDQGPLPSPTAAAPEYRCEGGLGLPIVKALSDEDGEYTDRLTGFHITWFRILQRPAAAAAQGACTPEGQTTS